ncbi:hypothetical protein M1M38_gp113 [Halorubrum tailed virus 27]|uniref:Uncharacterized protein n=1 Tax=Halorubrum tailed virus 27 TaxID=2878008 RepID=A0AAE8Y001_9CAUD|nr:hypothetical protein M1M38_gp113 [Halorubrum tailed virus 27]UBF22806.1 hypothetical protein [Halorubrum tailed virus 27]
MVARSMADSRGLGVGAMRRPTMLRSQAPDPVSGSDPSYDGSNTMLAAFRLKIRSRPIQRFSGSNVLNPSR